MHNNFKITDFAAIQMAVDACAAAGGGTVLVPTGEWHTGPIHLKSHVHIQFETGAKLIFSDVFEDYLPAVFTRWEGLECYNYSPLIYAYQCEDISITGDGMLYGSGEKWWSWKKLQQAAANELCYAQANGVPVENRVYATEKAALRPSFIQFIGCSNVLLSDFTIQDGPQWTIHPVYCEHVTVRNVNVITKGPNTDGLNPDSCNDVLIEGCHFETGDDCIAINAGMNGWLARRTRMQRHYDQKLHDERRSRRRCNWKCSIRRCRIHSCITLQHEKYDAGHTNQDNARQRRLYQERIIFRY